MVFKNKGKKIESSDFRLTRKERAAYSLVNFPNTVIGGLFSLLYINFFWDNLELNQGYFVLAQVIYAVINALNDFYFGRISDKTNFQKWGSRRLIYIKWAGPAWALVFFLIWFPWSTTNQFVIFIEYLVIICTFDSLLSLVNLVWLALMAELTESSAERNTMGLNNALFSILGIVPIMIGFILFTKVANLLYFRIFIGGLMCICGFCLYYVGITLKERPELYINQPIIPLFKGLKEVLSSRSYITMTLFRILNRVNNILITTFAFTYLYWLGDAYLIFSFLIPIVTLIGSIGYRKFSRKFEIRMLILWGKILQVILNVGCFLILLIPGTHFIVWIATCINSILGGFNIFDSPIIALVIDEDEVIHKQRREGLIVGTSNFFNRIVESITPILGTSILILFNFEKNSPIQSDSAIFGIKILYLIVPAIMTLISAIAFWFFPLKGIKLQNIKKDLHDMHLQKEQDYQKN